MKNEASQTAQRGGARVPAILGLFALAAVLLTLDAPGVTIDEPLDVRPGREYLSLAARTGWQFFTPEVIDRTYADNKEHPPLGRWLLGICSRLFEPIEVVTRGADPIGIYVRSGRVAPALCFALLVFLVSRAAGRSGGTPAAVGAGSGLMMMPRVFGHAHIAALDMFVACFWTFAFLAADGALRSDRPVRAMSRAGLILGLALLVKIHGWLLLPLVLVETIRRLGLRRGMAASSTWLLTGLAVFFGGWPWLWADPAGRLSAYLHTVDRLPTYVTYFGTRFADVDVPWHFPWVYFLCTVPIGLHALGIIGVVDWWRSPPRDPSIGLVLAAIALLLGVFSTRVPVYDGERLFLPAFALWALVIGRGFAWLWRVASHKRLLRYLLSIFLLCQAYGVVSLAPYWLSYYSLAVGGLPGAERLGLELTYWTDAVDAGVLERLARDAKAKATCVLVPTLAPGQGLVSTTAAMRVRELKLQDQEALADAEWVIVHRREAYWSPAIRELVRRPPVTLRVRQGVWLAGLWRWPDGKKKAFD